MQVTNCVIITTDESVLSIVEDGDLWFTGNLILHVPKMSVEDMTEIGAVVARANKRKET